MAAAVRDIFGSFVNKVMGVGPNEYDDYDEDERYYEEEKEERHAEYKRQLLEREEPRVKKPTITALPNSKVVTLQNDMTDYKVVVFSPNRYDDARVVCDNLKAFSPVIVKLDKLSKDEAQRVVDFVMGACYTMDGHVQEIKDDVFLVAPSMIPIEHEEEEPSTLKGASFLFKKFAK